MSARADVNVNRLSLVVSGLDEDCARALARLVAEGLAPSLTRAAAGTGLDHLSVEIDTHHDADPKHLAERVVTQVDLALLRELQQRGEAAP